jgi:TusA-related sulfurtransferase
MEGITITRECDYEQGFCWPPLMELIRDLTLAQTGDVLAITADDEENKEMIRLWLAKSKEELVSAETVGSATRFIVRKTH